MTGNYRLTLLTIVDRADCSHQRNGLKMFQLNLFDIHVISNETILIILHKMRKFIYIVTNPIFMVFCPMESH